MGDARLPDLNKLTLAGRVTWGPELKELGNNNFICKFGFAYNRKFKKNDGGRGEEGFFINCEIWGRAAEWANDDLSKGKMIIVEGSLKEHTWKKDGVDHAKMGIKVDKIHQLEWKDNAAVDPGAAPEEEVY